jgi:hypothetical protein
MLIRLFTFRMTDNNDNSSPGSHTNHILTIGLELGVEGGLYILMQRVKARLEGHMEHSHDFFAERIFVVLTLTRTLKTIS